MGRLPMKEQLCTLIITLLLTILLLLPHLLPMPQLPQYTTLAQPSTTLVLSTWLLVTMLLCMPQHPSMCQFINPRSAPWPSERLDDSEVISFVGCIAVSSYNLLFIIHYLLVISHLCSVANSHCYFCAKK